MPSPTGNKAFDSATAVKHKATIKYHGDQTMNPYIPFETAIQLLAMAYLASVMLLLAASQVGLAAISILEEVGD